MATQIKADMRDIADWHHRQHHNDWLTVVDTEPSGRYVCLCSGGYSIWVDAGNITKTRQGPELEVGPQADISACDRGR